MTDSKPDPGVFLVKGDVVSIPSFSISINAQGEIDAGPLIIHTGIDMTGYWLDIAYKHLLDTESAHKKLMLAKEEKNDAKISFYLKKESISGMQSIMASGIALDAYYASIKERVAIKKSTVDSWRKNGTARYKQISEVLRIGFHLNNETSNNLRSVLKQNLKFRDNAVHPSSGTAAPLLHVELNKITDWRYATFRLYNAKIIYGLTLSTVFKTASRSQLKTAESLKELCSKLTPRIKPLVQKWKRKFGELL